MQYILGDQLQRAQTQTSSQARNILLNESFMINFIFVAQTDLRWDLSPLSQPEEDL